MPRAYSRAAYFSIDVDRKLIHQFTFKVGQVKMAMNESIDLLNELLLFCTPGVKNDQILYADRFATVQDLLGNQ